MAMEETLDVTEVIVRSKLEGLWAELETEMTRAQNKPAILDLHTGGVRANIDPALDSVLAVQSKFYLMNKATNEAIYHLSSSLDTNCREITGLDDGIHVSRTLQKRIRAGQCS